MAMQSSVDFALGEDVRDEKRLKQDDEWASAIADGRGHVSHRELTMMHAPQFYAAIADYKIVEMIIDGLFHSKSSIRRLNEDVLLLIIEYAFPMLLPVAQSLLIRRQLAPHMEKRRALQCRPGIDFPFRICMRKRPLLSFEQIEGTYDAVHTDSSMSVTLHDGRLARNGRQLTMTHHQYIFDQVFADTASNDDVCKECIEPLLQWAEQGYKSTLICFGQTGTGKTYTFNAALNYISKRLVGMCLRVTFFEIRGKSSFDLLNQRKVVYLRSDEHDVIHVRGARQIMFGLKEGTDSPTFEHQDQLIMLLNGAMLLRSSERTERNPISSRSHAICFIEILSCETTITADDNEDNTFISTNEYKPEGQITLVDLAGSERNYETTSMTAAQHKESAEINFALMSLKDCFRAYHTNLSNDLVATDPSNELPAAIKNRAAVNMASYSRTKVNQEKRKKKFVTTPYSSTKYAYPLSQTIVPEEEDVSDYVSGNEQEPETAREDRLLSTSHGHNDPSEIEDSTQPSAQFSSTSLRGVRIPYRSTLLTRVLKDCFVSAPSGESVKVAASGGEDGSRKCMVGHHRTTIIATVSPTPVDLQHSINTLNHVVLMSPWLHPLVNDVQVEVPLTLGAATFSVPVDEWTAEQVNSWLAVAERGRFAQLVLPKGLDGKGLCELSAHNLASIFASGMEKIARKSKEGFAWLETGEEMADNQIHEKMSVASIDSLLHQFEVSLVKGAAEVAVDRAHAMTSLSAWVESNKMVSSAAAAAAAAISGDNPSLTSVATISGAADTATTPAATKKTSSGFASKYEEIGQALWNAVRREQRSAQVKAKMSALNSNRFNK